MDGTEAIKILEICADKAEIDGNKEHAEAFRIGESCIIAMQQFKWERDVAISQLNELGYGFGQKIKN